MDADLIREQRSSRERLPSNGEINWARMEVTCPRCGCPATAIGEARDGGVYTEWECSNDMCGLHGCTWTEDYSGERGLTQTLPPVAVITLANLRLAAAVIGVLLLLCLHYSGFVHAVVARLL
jgi:uncharacterized membrane protein YqaE (UPF0057 family)